MAGPHSDLFRSRAGGDPQRHRRVPKVVDAQALKTGCLGGRDPEARPKAGDPQRSSDGCGEDVAVWAPLCCEMRLELADDEGRQPDRSPAGSRLGRPEEQLSLHLRDDLRHGDRSSHQIDTPPAESGQLPDPETATGAHVHERPVDSTLRLKANCGCRAMVRRLCPNQPARESGQLPGRQHDRRMPDGVCDHLA